MSSCSFYPCQFRRCGSELCVEAQARHGLERWLDSFETLAVAAPVIPEEMAREGRETRWLPIARLSERVQLVPLPWAYRPDHFLRRLPGAIRILDRLIAESRYLQFAIGGLWGDWAAVAAELAIRQRRPYAVHTDNVAHDFVFRVSQTWTLRRRWQAKVDVPLMRSWHQRIIARADLGLFHGQDTLQAYGPWMRNAGRGHRAHNIHDIHDEGIFEHSEHSRFEAIRGSSYGRPGIPLRIVYAGRMAFEKAPGDWLNVVKGLHQRGVRIKAIWIGDGPLRDEFIQARIREGLEDIVSAPGFVADRAQVGEIYRSADLFLFTHLTRESPRCLLEALSFGIPIVGYDSAYARDLIVDRGGGLLVACGDWKALTDVVAQLATDSSRLAEMARDAAVNGARFTGRAVFSQRSALIKTFLP